MTDPHDNSYGPAGWTGAWTESNWGGGTIPGTLPAPGSEEPRENPAAGPRGFALRNDAGYFGGGNLGRPLHTFPRCFLRIVPRNGQFHWHIDFPGGIGTERLPPEFSYCVFYLDKADSYLTGQLGDDTSTGVLVWELMLTKTEVEQIDVLTWERLISEQYFNGFFYARSKVGGRYGSPTALVTVPIYDFVIPEKIKEFSIAEDPTYVEGSAQVYSNLTIEYVPPDNLDGFWGVALYIEGYQDNDQPRLLQMREYNPEFNGYGDDTFQCILEPWAPTVLENKYSGMLSYSAKTILTSYVFVGADWIEFPSAHGYYTGQALTFHAGTTLLGGLTDNTTYYAIIVNSTTIRLASTIDLAKAGTWIPLGPSAGEDTQYFSYYTTDTFNYGQNSVGLYLRKDFLKTTQRGVFYTVMGNYASTPNWSAYSAPADGKRFAGNTSYLTPEMNNPVRMGDALMCAGNSAIAIGSTFCEVNPYSNPNIDNIEAIIMHTGDEADANKAGKLTTALVSATNTDVTENLCYGNWKIVRTCKFYLVSINRSGYHAPLAENALTMYCALDGLPSAPPIVQNAVARQYATKNTISFSYLESLIEDVKEFCIYREVNGSFPERLTTIAAYSQFSDNFMVSSFVDYVYDDAELYNSSDHYGTLGANVKYYVSVVDKADIESAMKSCLHYDLNGLLVDSFGHRRHIGLDTGVMVVARNNTFNLLWNSECNWDASNSVGGTNGMGQCPIYEWALGAEQIENGAPDYTTLSNFFYWPPGAPYGLELYWDGTANRKYFYVTGTQAQIREWWKRISRATTVNAGALINDYPSFHIPVNMNYTNLLPFWSHSTFTGVISGTALISCVGIGRAKTCIPGIGYYANIDWLALENFGGLYYLCVGVTNYEPPLPDALTAIRAADGGRKKYYLSLPMEAQNTLGIYCPADTINFTEVQTYHRNGWTFNRAISSGAGYVPQTWNNGRIDILPTTIALTGSSIAQDFKLGVTNYSRYLTFSYHIARTSGTSQTGTATLSLQIRPTNDLMQPYEYNGGSIVLGAQYNLSEITSSYQYIVTYFDIVDPSSFASYNSIRLRLTLSDVPVGVVYSIEKPMLNVGSEAASYTSALGYALSHRLTSVTLNPDPPEQPSQYDDMCIAFGQDVILGDGRVVKVEDLKPGMILRGWFSQAEVKFNVHVKSAIHSKGETRIIQLFSGTEMEVTDEHACICEHGVKAASDVQPGDKMFLFNGEKDHKESKVVSNKPTGQVKDIVKLECSFPHTLYLNGILTHNMKTGEQG